MTKRKARYTQAQLSRFHAYADAGEWGFHPGSCVGAEVPRKQTRAEIVRECERKAHEIAPDYLGQLYGVAPTHWMPLPLPPQ